MDDKLYIPRNFYGTDVPRSAAAPQKHLSRIHFFIVFYRCFHYIGPPPDCQHTFVILFT